MKLITVFGPRLDPVRQDLALHQGLTCLENLGPHRQHTGKEHLFHRIGRATPDVLLVDLDVFGSQNPVPLLRDCRQTFPELRIVILQPGALSTQRQSTLYAMQILDILTYTPTPRGIGKLTRSLLYCLFHPRTLEEILPELSEPATTPAPVATGRQLISVGALCPGTGCTQLVMHLACCLDPEHSVLMVERGSNPVLEQYVLHPSDREAQSGLYAHPAFRLTRFLPAMQSSCWEQHRAGYSVTLMDLGVIDTAEKESVLSRSDLVILVTTGSAWHMHTVMRRKDLPLQSCLWLNFCPEHAFSDYVHILGSMFRGYYAGRYSPDPLAPEQEQQTLIRTLLKQQKLAL